MLQRTNTKQFSNKQESMIADYLGWKQVGGSGARPFAPGDVNAYQWLGECKTHIEERANIIFMKSHWFKICDEARSKGRYPVLFVDNGTQTSNNTWVMIPFGMLDPAAVNMLPALKNSSRNGATLIFDNIDARDAYKQGSLDGKLNIFTVHWDRDLAIMPLSTFRDFVEENF